MGNCNIPRACCLLHSLVLSRGQRGARSEPAHGQQCVATRRMGMEVRRSLSDLYECRTVSINLHSTAVAYSSAIPFPLLLYLWGARGKPGHGAVYHRSQAVVRTAAAVAARGQDDRHPLSGARGGPYATGWQVLEGCRNVPTHSIAMNTNPDAPKPIFTMRYIPLRREAPRKKSEIPLISWILRFLN